MGGDKTIGPEGDNYVRAQFANKAHYGARGVVKVRANQRPVGVVEHFAVGYAKMPAGVCEFLTPYRLQRIVRRVTATVGRPLSRSKTDYGTLHACFGIFRQDSTESTRFIIGMRDYTEQL
jgi:hypothetical protein